MENIDPLPMNYSSAIRVDAVPFPTDSRISVSTAAAEDEEISISSPLPRRKRQLDPKDSDEVKRRKTRPVRSSNTTNANANADYESEDSDDEMVQDDMPATPSFNGRRVLSTKEKLRQSPIAATITCLKICIFNTANLREDSCNRCSLPFNANRRF